MNFDEITLDWANERPVGTDEAVRADLARELRPLKDSSQLLYHTVFLGPDLDADPGVVVEGGDESFTCTYYGRIGEAFVTAFPNLGEEYGAGPVEAGHEPTEGTPS